MKLVSKKTKKVIMIICLVIVISSILTGILGAADNDDDQKPVMVNHEDDLEFINDELIVKLKTDVLANGRSTDAELNQLLKKHKFKSMSRIIKGKIKRVPSGQSRLNNKKSRLLEGFSRTYKIKFEGDISKNIHRIIEEFKNFEQVEWVEPNYIYQASVQTNDPYTSSTGSWGQSYADLWGFHAIQLDNIWAVTRGSNAIVAVIDTGLDFDHEDLYFDSNSNGQLDAGEPYNVYINEIEDINQNGIVDAADFNGIDDDSNGYVDDIRGWDFVSNTNDPTDDHGHGSHCAGIIAAMNDNNLGLTGVAPDARIMVLKGLNQVGSGSSDTLAAAIYYAVDNGAQIISNSWGGLGTSQLMQDAIDYADTNNCIVIAAAGNDAMNTKQFFPAGLDGVLTVGALNPDLGKADFSNHGSCVDVSAPGVDILSLRAAGTNMYGNVNNLVPVGDSDAKYYRANGTSMACPFVSGVAALLVSLDPGYLRNKVEQLIVNTTDELVFESYYLGTGMVSGNDLMNQIDQYTNAEASINSDINDYDLISSSEPLNITGIAAGDSYILEYGEGNYPSTWYTLASGSQVFDDTLGAFTTADKDGTYRFRLTVQEGNRQAITTSLIWVDLSIIDGWPVDFKTMVANPHTSTIEDIDNDGAGEIFIGTNGYCFGLKGDGTILPNWPQEQSEYLHYKTGARLPGPSIADIDNDNSREIFWTNSNVPEISRWAFNGKNPDYTDRVNFPQNALCPLYGKAYHVPMVLEDLDNNGTLEIISGFNDGSNSYRDTVIVFDQAGNSLFTYNINTPETKIKMLIVADCDNDNEKEIIVLAEKWQQDVSLYILDQNGTLKAGYPMIIRFLNTTEKVAGHPYMLDLDDDDDLEIIMPTSGSNGYIYAYHHDGQLVDNYPIVIGNYDTQLFECVTADLDHDGVYEYIVTMRNRLQLLHTPMVISMDGTFWPGWDYHLEDIPRSQIAIVDIDNDGNQDICFTSNMGFLYAYDKDGNPIQGYPKKTGSPTTSGVSAGDIDGDGLYEIVATTLYGRAVAWDTITPVSRQNAEWPSQLINERNNAVFTKLSDEPEDLITNMVCYDSTNAANWSVQTNIQEGDGLYGDRSYTINTLPSSYAGSDWIRTACSSKSYTGDPLVTFTVTRDTCVYVAHDDRISTLPGWLSSWTDTNDDLIDSQPVSYSIYSKFYTAGSQVSLGTNGQSSGCCGYSIIVKESIPVNQAPQVDIDQGGSITTSDRTISLTATVSDDGLPSGSILTCLWTLDVGPAQVIFSDPDSANTSVTFTEYGTYTLRLEVDDTMYYSYDDITVTYIPGDLITNMVCYDSTNAANWSVQTNIQEGDGLYGDRSYTINTLPSSYAGSDWIRTACSSKSYTGDPLVTFTVTRDAYVYVAHDDRISTLPGWLSSWTDTNDDLIDSQPVSYSIYSKFYTAGSQVSLGTNGQSGGCCGYTIMVK